LFIFFSPLVFGCDPSNLFFPKVAQAVTVPTPKPGGESGEYLKKPGRLARVLLFEVAVCNSAERILHGFRWRKAPDKSHP